MRDTSNDPVAASGEPGNSAAGPHRREVEEGHSPVEVTAQKAPRPSTRRFIAFVIVALLLAGAVVAHLLTGPGLSH